jgi:hypothetical protein
VGLGVVAAVFVLLCAAVASLAAANLISNGTFEGGGSGSLTGWGASGGNLTLVAGDGGGHAARITVTNTPAQMYAFTTTKPVKSTTAGTTYDLSGSVSSVTAGQTVCLKLKEQPAGKTTNVGTGQQCIVTTSWQDFPVVAYTALKSGDTLTVNVAEANPKATASFDIDNLSLVVAGTDGVAPTVPQNVNASSSSSTTADVFWDASTDNVGVTGYTVLRDGSVVGSVGGGQLTFHDTGLSPSTGYGYTVEAFDAAGNTSAASSPAAQVTTQPGGGGGGGPCGILPAPASPVYSHVIVIMDENLGYSSLIGSSQAPYTNQIASDCALATNAVGATHPSQPNYIALMSGLLVPWTGSAQHSAADNLLHQLGVAGKGWTALEENMPANCDSSSVFPYKTGHNPGVWFNDLQTGSGGDGSCKTSDVPFTVAGFNAAGLPAFTFITPNQCNDMHWVTGCAGSKANRIQTGDAWLQTLLPKIFASSDYQNGNTLVILTWDEGNESGTTGIDCTTVANIDSAGCHVATIAMSAYVTPGTRDGKAYSDYSVLAAIENMWGLPLLGKAQTATPLGSGMGF